MVELVTVPYLGTAEEDVLVADWLVEVGESFRQGQALVVLETLKASFEVEADADGVLLRRLVEKGTRVPLHAALGVRGDAADEAIDEAALEQQVAKLSGGSMVGGGVVADEASSADVGDDIPGEASSSPPRSAQRVPASPTARRRARELGVDLSQVRGTGRGGMITISDVEKAESTAGASPAARASDGTLDPDFVSHLRRNAESFRALDSEFKVDLYRKHGAIVGPGVSFGEGAIVVADRLVLGAKVHVGASVRVDAVHFEAGDLACLSKRCSMRARKIVLGENAFFAPDAEVGGGGVMDPEAELVLGSHGFVGEHVHLNPCRPLHIGDEVTISRNASLMTHSFANSMLEGYPVRFAGIEVGDKCQIGISCTLFPGVTMGEASILMSNSCLVTSMPAGRVFAGTPAADLKAAAEPVDEARRLELALRIVRDFAAALRGRGKQLSVEEPGEASRRIVVEHDGHRHELRFSESLDLSPGELVAEDLRVCLRASDEQWSSLPVEVSAFDLHGKRVAGASGPLYDAFREFLRKRGIRLEPRTWTYRGAWL